jgi:hypothetical protein
MSRALLAEEEKVNRNLTATNRSQNLKTLIFSVRDGHFGLLNKSRA